MKYMITEKLLNAICGFKVKDITIDRNIISFITEGEGGSHTNDKHKHEWLHWDNKGYGNFHYTSICELSYACKEWAFNNYRCSIDTTQHTPSLFESTITNRSIDNNIPPVFFREESEYKTIFKACEYIIKNIKLIRKDKK